MLGSVGLSSECFTRMVAIMRGAGERQIYKIIWERFYIRILRAHRLELKDFLMAGIVFCLLRGSLRKPHCFSFDCLL